MKREPSPDWVAAPFYRALARLDERIAHAKANTDDLRTHNARVMARLREAGHVA